MLDESRYADIDTVLDRRGPWTAEEFVGGQQVSSEAWETSSVRADDVGQGCVEKDGQGACHRCWRIGMRDPTELSPQ